MRVLPSCWTGNASMGRIRGVSSIVDGGREKTNAGKSDDAETLFSLFGDHAGIPGRIPNQIHGSIADAIERHDLFLGVRRDHRSHTTARRCKSHFDGNFIIVDFDVVDQTEIDDIDRDLWIVTLVQRFIDLFFGNHWMCSLCQDSRTQLETIFRPWDFFACSDAIDNCPANFAAISRKILLTSLRGSWTRLGTPLSPPSRNVGVIGISPR